MIKNRDTNINKKDTVSRNDLYQIRQYAKYDAESGKVEPDNNIFWEERSNPLSTKGK